MTISLKRSDQRNIWLEIPSEHIAVPLTLGDGAQPRLIDGFNGWEVHQRSRRRGIMYWGGAPPWKQEVPILLDAWVERDYRLTDYNNMTRAQFVALQYHAIEVAFTPATVTTSPPLCRLSGEALKRQGGNWALIDVQETATPMREHPSGRLLRYEAMLTFQQLVSRDEIDVHQNPRTKRYRITTLRQAHCVTIEQLAVKYLHNAKRWKDITFADGSHIRDPDAVKPTAKLRVPYE